MWVQDGVHIGLMELLFLFRHHLHLQLKLTLMRQGRGKVGGGKGGYWEEKCTEEEGEDGSSQRFLPLHVL